MGPLSTVCTFCGTYRSEEAIAETARLTNEWHEPVKDKKRELE